MAEQETYNPYTLADIERYLQGKMTAAEMHAMEKAALQDPFLSDAIEGYSRAPLTTAHEHLNDIAAALYAGREEAKVVTMPVKKRRWANWAAAAAAVVAVVVAILLITTPADRKTTKNLAAKQTNTPVFTDTPANPQPVAAAPADGSIAALAKKDDVKTPTNDSTAAGFSYRQPAVSKGLVSSDKMDENKQANEVVTLDSAPFNPGQPTFARTKKLNKAKVFGNAYNNGYLNNNAVGNAADNNVVLANKVSGPSYQQNLNTQLPVTANATTFASTISNDSLNATLNGRVAGLNVVQPNKEMFLPPADNSKARKTSGNAMQIVLTPIPGFDTVAITYLNNKNKSPKMVVDSSLSPQGGWENFRDYVVKRLDKNADTSDLAEGDVELEFTIDDRGLARDIKITRSLDIEHDAKAADLVKKWPGWITSKKQKKGKVVIQF